jgi:hypothetical protein
MSAFARRDRASWRREMADTERLNVAVWGPNPEYPGAVLLETSPCPYCGKPHYHGSPSAGPNPDGTYGSRVPHCGPHTHSLSASGQRAHLTTTNRCHEYHPQYVLMSEPVAEAK